MPSFFPKLRAVLLLAFGLCFGFQAVVALPLHNAHGKEQVEARFGDSDSESAPADGHCDFFLAFHSLDSSSVVAPPALGLMEAAFSVVAAYASYDYSVPSLFPPARGPPLLV